MPYSIHHLIMSANIIPATPAKLKDGTWGARVLAVAKPGQRIEVRTRSGKSWTALVATVLWSGEGASIVTTSRDDSPPTPVKPVRRKRASQADRRPRGGCGYPGCDGRRYCDECSD